MKKKSRMSKVLCNTLIGSAMWMLGQTASLADCNEQYYVVWVEGDADILIVVRHVLVDPSGTSDLYGTITIPDEGVGSDNPSYMHRMAINAFINNTKVRIFTNDTDCVISSNAEQLGTAIGIDAADFF